MRQRSPSPSRRRDRRSPSVIAIATVTSLLLFTAASANADDPCDRCKDGCHIWVYLPEDRTKAGDLFVYGCEGEVIFWAPVRGAGKGGGNKVGPLETNGDTPTGDYQANIEAPQKPSANGPYGAHEVIRLTGRGDYSKQPAIASDAKKAKRPGLLIHGGRRDKATDAEGTIYYPKEKTSARGRFKRPMGTFGCLRLYEDLMAELISAMRSEECCKKWYVHVREEAVPDDWTKKPAWTKPSE